MSEEITLKEAADLVGRNIHFARECIYRGQLPIARRDGQRILVAKSSLVGLPVAHRKSSRRVIE
ncbi:MAG: hypothetical protein JO347_10380 [Candidatus Eremiobacteraeota bacterium]|nr:hypothetical protein [Candidatus Eremiobacteraeota bacterium]